MTIAGPLDACVWREVAEIAVEIGPVRSWVPSGAEWGGATWGVDTWGSQYLTPAAWLDVTRDVLTVDTDTGRNGIDDPGEIASASLTLDDRTGAHGIAGEKGWIGDLLRVTAKHVASGTRRVLFFGKITEDQADESLSTPTISIRAVDILGGVLSTDDTDSLGAQSVRERLDELLDRAGFPINRRELDDDVTALLATDRPGSRLDAARGAASSSMGGTLYAENESVIFRHGAVDLDPSTPARFSIGTVEGAVCPSTLTLAEAIGRVWNVYAWSTSDQSNPISASASDAGSIHRNGRRANVRTDLLNTKADELDLLVRSELARSANPGDAVDACSIPVHDDLSAELVLAGLGDLVAFDYTGADPWSSSQLIGSVAHHVAPDSWTIDLKCYEPQIGAAWGVAEWGVSTWSSV